MSEHKPLKGGQETVIKKLKFKKLTCVQLCQHDFTTVIEQSKIASPGPQLGLCSGTFLSIS